MGRAAAASKKSRFVHRTTDTPYVARHAAKGRLSVVAAYLVYRVAAIRFRMLQAKWQAKWKGQLKKKTSTMQAAGVVNDIFYRADSTS